MIQSKTSYVIFLELFMIDALAHFFVSIFGTHSGIATVIISMFPLIELKGGIPVGMSTDFWGENALNGTQSFLLAMLGSCLVVPIIALIFKPIVNWLKRTKLFKRIGHLIDEKVKNHSESINSKTSNEKSAKKKTWLKALFIFGFVAVPLPLTGVWTGTCVAVAIGLNFWQTVLSCVCGNMVAGLIIVTVCAVFPQFTTILFIVFLVFILCVIAWAIIKKLIKKSKAKKSSNNITTMDKVIINSDDVKVTHSDKINKNAIEEENNTTLANELENDANSVNDKDNNECNNTNTNVKNGENDNNQ